MLWFTHSVAAIVPALVVYLVMSYICGKGIMTEARKAHVRAGLFMLAAAAFVIAIGVQAKLAQDDNRDRDRANARFSACLNHFAADLVDTLNTRVAANERLTQAQTARDRAADRVIVVVALARRIPPEATDAQFTQALEAFVTAKANLSRVQREVKSTLDANPYPAVTPEAACS